MKNGKKLIAGAIIATTLLAATAPASAADRSDVAKGAILGIITGAILASAHDDHRAPERVVYREPSRVAYHAPQHVYYDAPVYYPKRVYVTHTYAPRYAKLKHRNHSYKYQRWGKHDSQYRDYYRHSNRY